MIILTGVVSIFSMFGFGNVISCNADEFESYINEGYKIIDVRTKQEHNQMHIDNSVLIDIYSSDFSTKINKLKKEEKYLVYCASGSRSRSACMKMKEMGFNTVINLSGGISSWINSGKNICR